MFVTGNYVTLQVDGIRYLEKAPLPYWLAAFGYRIFGVNEFAAHLPNALAVLLLGWGWSGGDGRSASSLGSTRCCLCYVRRPVDLVNGRSSSMWFGSTYPDAPRIFLSDADLLAPWTGDGRVFLFVPPHLNAQVEELLPRRFVIARASGKTVYSNQP